MPWVKSNLGCIALALTLQTQTALGQGDLLGTDEMAEAIVAMTSRHLPEKIQRELNGLSHILQRHILMVNTLFSPM